MRREEVDLLNRHGIHLGMSMDAMLGAEYIGMTGRKEDAAPWLTDFSLAMDAQPTLITTPNSGIPAYLTNLVDPEVIDILTSPMKAAEIFGEVQKGNWTTLSTQFPVLEHTGEVSSYGDYNNNGSTGANVNWVARQSYHFQTISQWGERETEMYGLARIAYASEINVSSVLVLNKFLNNSYFFGVAGLANYGALNDPGLIAAIAPTTKAAGGTTWAVATPDEIYQDFVKLFAQLQSQMGGLVPNRSVKMTLALSPTLEIQLLKRSAFNVMAREAIMAAFPNMTIETAPEYSTVSGELMQLKLDSVNGKTTTYAAFTEKLRTHAVIPDLSSWKQKKSAGTWGTIIRRYIAVAQMIGM